MEHDELDKIIRKKISEDDSNLDFEELQSKEAIWGSLDINEEAKRPVRKLPNWWLLAATLLLLIAGTGLINMYGRIQTATAKYQEMEQEYNKVANDFKSVKNQLLQLDKKFDQQIEESRIQAEQKIVVNPQIKPQHIEKVIYMRDTIYSIQRIEEVASIEYIRDTVFVKEEKSLVDVKPSVIPDSLEQKDIAKSNNELPKKVEFVIEDKSMEKPQSLKFEIQLNGSAIARKNN